MGSNPIFSAIFGVKSMILPHFNAIFWLFLMYSPPLLGKAIIYVTSMEKDFDKVFLRFTLFGIDEFLEKWFCGLKTMS